MIVRSKQVFLVETSRKTFAPDVDFTDTHGRNVFISVSGATNVGDTDTPVTGAVTNSLSEESH